MGGMPSVLRHHFVMREGIPDQYKTLKNPLVANDKTLAKGKQLYQDNCAACHGVTGAGNGEAGEALTPRPADLRHLMRMSWMASDGYLFWTIAEGGKPIGSDMPAFKETLGDDGIWNVVLYLRGEI